MEQNLLTKKKLKEKSIEYQIPFADLLEVFLQETLMFQILETDFAKRLWLKTVRLLTSTVIERSGRSHFILYTGRMMGKNEQVLDEKWITDFAEAICAKREYHIRWNYSVEKRGTGLSGLHNWRMGGNEGSAYHPY